MSRNVFGWDMPPGCTTADIDRQARIDDTEDRAEKIEREYERADRLRDEQRDAEAERSLANKVDGYDRDNLGESPDY